MSLLLSFGSFMSSFGYIILAIVVLLIMVLIHELGHYTAGKILKFKINEFSVGFGKTLLSKTNKSGEKISLRLFPLGGYCAFEGEDEEGNSNPDSFNNQKPWKRLIVLFMGPFFNLLAGILFSVIFLTCYGYADRLQVTSVVAENNPYQTTTEWFMEGDVIYGVNGKKTNFVYDQYFKGMIVKFEDTDTFDVNVIRDGKKIVIKGKITYVNVVSKEIDGNTFYTFSTKDVSELKDSDFVYVLEKSTDASGVYNLKRTDDVNTVYTSNDEGVFIIGDTRLKVNNTSGIDVLQQAQIGIGTKFYKYGFFEALWQAIPFTFGWAWKVLITLWYLIIGKLSILGLTGPVGTITTIASVTQMSAANLLLLLPLISANLAVFNLLPFPALDGARMVFVFIEWIFRKPINRKIEGYIHTGGLIFLLAFVVIIDILHFVL